jgi:hypothetical protein
MRRLLPLAAVLLALGFAACGDDDETSSTAGATGASGTAGPATAGAMTAGEFLKASIPDQIEAVADAAAANPDCADADTSAGSDFQVQVAIDAAGTDPDTPLAEVVADNC